VDDILWAAAETALGKGADLKAVDKLAAVYAAAPETAAERDRLREVNAELVKALVVYHDRYWDTKSHGCLPTHEAGDWPADCAACMAIAKSTADDA
jgi:hypothetical protein